MANRVFTPARSPSTRLLQIFGTGGALMVLLFAPAGRLDWWMGWVFLGTAECAVIFGVSYLERVNADLADERRSKKTSVQSWDYVLTNVFSLVFIPLALVTAGLDQRFGWSAAFPGWLQVLGLIVGVLAASLLFRLMAVNPFFSSYVRIQKDRGHHTVRTGPYRYIRHPGNLLMLIAVATIPLILGSWPAAIPTAVAIGLVILRTALEDRTLKAELPGYAAYADETRYRLIPRIW